MRIVCLVVGLAVAGCSQVGGGPTYTLYRSGLDRSRVHVATFDAAESGSYNEENCLTAMDLFDSQPGVSVRYWCEKGRFKGWCIGASPSAMIDADRPPIDHRPRLYSAASVYASFTHHPTVDGNHVMLIR